MNEELVVLAIIFALVILAGAFSPMMSYGYGMMGWSSGGPFFIFGWLICLLVIVALILLIIWLVRQLSGDGSIMKQKVHEQRRSR